MSVAAPAGPRPAAAVAPGRPARPPARIAAWYATGGAVVGVAGFLLPPGPVRVVLYATVSASAAAALAYGVLRWRPAASRAWWALAAGQLVYVAADVVFYATSFAGRHRFPSVTEYLYLAHYPFVAYALLALSRVRDGRRNAAAILDAAIVATAAALLLWTLLLSRQTITAATAEASLVAMSFPVMDLLVLTFAVRLLVSGGRTSASHLLLCGSALLLCATDTVYVLMLDAGTYRAGNVLDLLWIGSYLLLGAAALHPSIRDVGTPARVAERPGPGRLALLAVAALAAPAAHMVSHLGYSESEDIVVAVVSGLTFVLVILRLGLVMRRQAQVIDAYQAAQQALERQRAELERSERERGRLLEKTMEVAEAERTRVAVEIHDGPIQRLAALGFLLDRGERTVQRGRIAEGLALYGRARHVITEEVAALRRLMSDLRPPALDQKGLEAALRDELARFSREHGTKVRLHSDLAGRRLPPDAETVLYRVSQEALNNVAKHAVARSVLVELSRRDGVVRMRVRDDGRGFDSARITVESGEHFGLAAMRERVVRAGGEWGIESRPDGGTTVVVELPVQRVAA